MKSLIISAFIILASMSECTIPSTEYALISFKTEGRTYSSENYEYPGGYDPIYPHEFYPAESCFTFRIYRELYAGDDHGCMLAITVEESSEFTLDKKYEIDSKRGGKATSYIRLYDFDLHGKQQRHEYKITEGWISFTDYSDSYTYEKSDNWSHRKTTYSGHYLFGRFEFTATDEESGETIRITDGKFENLKALR